MNNTDAGGYAFPSERNSMPNRSGMTLRDYLAAKAMSGLVVNGDNFDLPKLTAYSYQIADAMLKAREA